MRKWTGQFFTLGAKNKKFRPIISMMRFITTFARYVAAIFMASVVSMAISAVFMTIFTFLHYWPLSDSIVWFVFDLALVAAGFCGVFVGSLCLEQAGRRAGSIILLILGLSFDVCMQLTSADGKYPHISLGPLVSLTLGGLGAVILIFQRRPKVLFR